MTESPMLRPTREKHEKLLCVFSKWCRTLSCAYFGGVSNSPNTAAIFWFKDAASASHDSPDREYFCIFTNLAPSKSMAKEDARLIRKRHLGKRLGELGIEPKASSLSNIARNTKFGHCAETLALTRCVVRLLWCLPNLHRQQLYVPGSSTRFYKDAGSYHSTCDNVQPELFPSLQAGLRFYYLVRS